MKKLMNVLLVIIIIAITAGGMYFLISNINKEKPEKIENKVEEEEAESYSIENKDTYLYEDNPNDIVEEYRGFKLLEYKNASDYAEIYCILYDYTTDLSCYYSIKATDESGNNLLFNNEKEEKIYGGIVENIKIKNVALTSKINVEVLEKEDGTEKVNNSAKVQIDLSQDLAQIQKINQFENSKTRKLGDIEFSYIDDKYVYFGTTEHAYSENLIGENSSLPIKIQYGNRLVSQEHIEFWYEKNVNNLSLDEAFTSLSTITEKMGQYGLSDVYGMNIVDGDEEITDTVIVTYEQMMKLCKGENIKVDGKAYSPELFNEFTTLKMIKDKDVEIRNGIKAVKYHFETDDGYENYMFIYEDNIYYIKVPLEARISEEVETFLNSLKIK